MKFKLFKGVNGELIPFRCIETECMPNTVIHMVNWLENHHITVIGSTDSGVCVVEERCRNGVGYGETVWLPANINYLRNWMGY